MFLRTCRFTCMRRLAKKCYYASMNIRWGKNMQQCSMHTNFCYYCCLLGSLKVLLKRCPFVSVSDITCTECFGHKGCSDALNCRQRFQASDVVRGNRPERRDSLQYLICPRLRQQKPSKSNDGIKEPFTAWASSSKRLVFPKTM